MKTIKVKRTGFGGNDYAKKVNTPANTVATFDTDAELVAAGQGDLMATLQRSGVTRVGFFEFFDKLPSTSITATTCRNFSESGTGTEVITKAAKGGVNLKSQATTPAELDEVLLVGVANTLTEAPITATSKIIFSARVAINTITKLTFSVGLNENLTSAAPDGTAGEGAMFQFSDGVSANWYLAHKVNGTDTTTDTGIPVVASQDYELRIEIGTDLKAVFYIDGVRVGTGPALTSGDKVIAMAGLVLSAEPGGQKDADIRYISMSRVLD